jgi:glycerophosphoryl diester phosphodiesterase
MPVLSSLLSFSHASVIAHRGGSKLRPENTIPAFDHAASLGVAGFECDVHLSRDGEVVVIHDATLERTTDATGPVSGRTAAELARVDAGFRFGAEAEYPHRGQGIGVPTLAELLERHPSLPIIVEIKGERPETAARAIAVVREGRAESRVIVAGFSDVVLREARRLAPEIPTSASSDEVRSAVRRAHMWVGPRRTGFQVFQMPLRIKGREVITRRFVRTARRAGVPVHAWIIDDRADMRRLLDWGVTGLITDRPDLALSLAKNSSRGDAENAEKK